jgi:hypothetical protein
MKLLCIHIDLEFQMRLFQCIHLKHSNSTLIINYISFMFAAHLCLSLLPREFIVLIPFQVSFKSLLHYLFHFLLHSRGVCDGLFAHNLHIVTEFHLGEGDRHEAELNFLLLIFFFIKTFHASESFLFLVSEMERDYQLINSFNVVIL